ncbi:UPF0182 family protein [Desulfitispora alkaliphila]|uniref:UPF0182 family membrane protein n=1 Tax=Desulfitispora alkaliphila TaxID=622674 RepID=UPI003D254794
MKFKSLFAVIALLFLLVLGDRGIHLVTDLLWFASFGYESVLVTIVTYQWITRLVAAFIIGIFIYANLYITLKVVRVHTNTNIEYLGSYSIPFNELPIARYLTERRIKLIYILTSIFFAFSMSAVMTNQWSTILKYLNSVNFGQLDPLFDKDISFYIFQLPFYQLLHSLFMGVTVLTLLLVVSVYVLFTPRGSLNFQFQSHKQPQVHLSALGAFLFLLIGIKYKFNTFNLLYSQSGAVFGAGFTDINVKLPVYNFLAVLAIITAIYALINIFLNKRKVLFIMIISLVTSSLLLAGILPAVVERFYVEPNQFAREQDYLEYNIEYTRNGYALNNIQEKPFELEHDFSKTFIEDNANTLQNVRLWDWRPLKETYDQLQGLRPYYKFTQINIDRYDFDGDYRQVMLGARELDYSYLPERAQTWQNQKLRYTHGYGLAMSPATEVTSGGQPEFLIKDMPPRVEPNLGITVDRPEIYFGELTTEYVVANSKSEEVSYPSGTDNVYTNYSGTGGIQLNSFFKKALYAYKLKDFRLLLSSEIEPESRLLYDRDIDTMVKKLAPFLKFDSDYYLVLSEGRLYWIRDAYTTSSLYPYSEPTRGWGNYVRNSVKVVVDAYNGSVNFYISDESDPIIKSYNQMFPNMFKSINTLDDNLQKHIRYPVDFFAVQAHIFTNYHMQNPRVFYNREDAWNIPEEQYRGQSQLMDPYYTIMELPGVGEPEYVLMLPFTPERRRNMVSWLAARNDGDNYGQMILYRFPKEGLVYGPAQINARIDQDTEISQQLTLWDQRGSQVLRGNMMVLPIANSILYVEPLFLQAEQSNIPELSRVIVSYEEEIVMAETFEQALREIFKDEAMEQIIDEATEGEDFILNEQLDSLEELIEKANELYQAAQESLSNGEWAEYGEKMKELETILKRLNSSI